jgi:DNA-binding MarR family transcriptional regulator
MAVATPRSMGEVAQALRCTASNATHHVSALEQAGLVARRRHGKTVLVMLTPRGVALVSLLRERD